MASNEIEILDPAASVEKLKKNAAGRALNRRHFLAALGMTGAAAGAGLMSGCSTSNTVTATTAGTAQTDVLNFVLNFKYLEATFYANITTGGDLPSSATTGGGSVSGGSGKLVFTGANAQQITDMLNEIYFDEKNHVTTLISLLGSAYVFRPAINLAAFGAITPTNALSIARLLEDVGVTAMAAAATSLSTSNLTLVSQILAIESVHAGALRLTSIQNPTIAAYLKADAVDVAPFDPGTAALAAAGPTANGGFFTTAGASSWTVATPAGMAFSRSSSQVLSILYGTGAATATSGATSGGFFPNGVNGNIKTV
jgi:Ferritin-like domain